MSITSSEHGDRWRARFVSVLHMPERIFNTNETQGSYLPATSPVAGSINNIYSLVDFSSKCRWKRSLGFATHGKGTGLEITPGFQIGGSRATD
jgi:hypothetical protein